MIKLRKIQEEYTACDGCGDEISHERIQYDFGDFCSEPCRIFFLYPTKDDWLKAKNKANDTGADDVGSKESPLPMFNFDVSQGGKM